MSLARSLGVLLALCFWISQASAQPDYRIPDTFSVTQQAVHLTLDPDADSYSGQTTLSVEVITATDALVLHWIDLNVSDIQLRTDTKSRALSAQAGEWDMHTLSDGNAITPGRYTLELSFSGDYSTDALGLYKATEQGINYLFTQYEMTLARRAFPMVDEPDSKIPWDVTITAPEALKVAANTPMVSETTAEGWTTRVFKTTKPMPSYLLALTVGDFDVTPIPGLSVPGVMYSPKNTGADIGYSARVTSNILAALERYFDIPYPYEKLDFVAVPNFTFGAMENVGLVTYRAELLLNGDDPAPNSALATANVIAHELAHQWYGNLVTMAWWDDLWLNEAFASWMAYKVTAELHPEFRTDVFLPQGGAFPTDALGATSAIRKEVKTEEDVLDGLGLNYSKGHAILNMLEQAMGESDFRSGIRDYMRDHSWGNTKAADLWVALEAQANFKVGEVAETFLNQPGFPLINIDTDGNLHQRRYENEGAGLAQQNWTVPMSLLVAEGDTVTERTITLNDVTQAEPSLAKADWLLPAAGSNGYYTWYTGEVRYARLIKSINQLSDREKLGVLVNGKQLLSAAVVGMDQHMTLVNALAGQANEELVLDAIEEIRYVAEMYRGTHLEPALRQWVSELLDPWYAALGIAPRADDSQSQIKLRARVLRVLAQLGNNDALRGEMIKLAQAYMNDSSAVDAGIALEALRIQALYAGDADLAKRYLASYASTDNAVVKSTLRSAMYFTDPAATELVMAAVADGRINSGDLASVMGGLFYANVDQAALYDSYQTHYDAIADRLPEFYRPMMPQLTSAQCNQENGERQQAFYSERGNQFELALRKSREATSNCLNTKHREIESVGEFLSVR